MVLRWYLHLFTSDIQVSKFSIYFEVAIYSIEWEPIAHNLSSRYSAKHAFFSSSQGSLQELFAPSIQITHIYEYQ